MNYTYYLVKYQLYGMHKKIAFFTQSQCGNWQSVMEQLNDSEYTAFTVEAIETVTVLGGERSFCLDEM